MNTIVLEHEAPPTLIVDELDREDKADGNGDAPPQMPNYRAAALERAAQTHSGSSSRILVRLLSMADAYRESGSLRQAIEMYFELIREHAETPQGHRAEERLFDVARSYERSGELRQARGIYEQLL
jgi:tetratricopeptide (TPR) repeat protein